MILPHGGTNLISAPAGRGLACLLLVTAVAGCGATRPHAGRSPADRGSPTASASVSDSVEFERDRAAIRAMAGAYEVTFEFWETVSFRENYRTEEPFRTGGREVVRVIEDSGDFISLQHILVVEKKEEKRAIKHWRQDWIYEPDSVLVYIGGVNRHAITPFGWVHEQDNVKLVLTGRKPRALVRELGVNTYRRSDEVASGVADRYWAATKEFWAGVRAAWQRVAAEDRTFGLTVRGEPAPVYRKLLGLADEVKEDATPTEQALEEARAVIDRYTTTEVGTLAERLRPDTTKDRP